VGIGAIAVCLAAVALQGFCPRFYVNQTLAQMNVSVDALFSVQAQDLERARTREIIKLLDAARDPSSGVGMIKTAIHLRPP
jgi:hypothetical protein